jgi:D-tyrosyl-tRNA(Tyr) deacylase
MITLLQRVSCASCVADGVPSGKVGRGLMLLVCAERGDTEKDAVQLAEKVLKYRVFADENGKMNLSVTDIGGGLLVVPQFTLAADTQSGTRPSFSKAAPPEEGKRLFEAFVRRIQASGLQTGLGVFGAHMQVSLVNDGPVTFWLQVPKKEK